MTTMGAADIGDWYRDGQGRNFEVVAVDEADELIAVQFFDGEVGELSFDVWAEIRPKAIAPPEDWSGPFDDIERDDFGDTERVSHPEDWAGPWTELDQRH